MLHPEQRAGTSGTANVATNAEVAQPPHPANIGVAQPPQPPAIGPSQPPQSQEGSTITHKWQWKSAKIQEEGKR